MRTDEEDDDADDLDGDPDESEMDQDAGEEMGELLRCPHCRRMIHEESERCPECGKYISEEDAPSRTRVWVLVGAVLALLGFVLYYVL